MVPFQAGRIVSGRDFCGREEEIKRLREYLESGNRMYIQGERRVGKSSLVVETVRRMRGWRLLRVDLLAVKAVADIARRLVNGMVALEADQAGLKGVLKKFAALRPTLKLDPLTNEMSVGLSAQREVRHPEDLDLALAALEQEKKTVLFFDEFQDVLNLPDAAQVLAVMRARIQVMQLPVVYAGSIRNQMESIFNDPAAAFYKSAMNMHLGPIEEKRFGDHIRKRFEDGRRTVGIGLIPAIYELGRGNPGDMQKLCLGLWDTSNEGDLLGPESTPDALSAVWAMEEQNYENCVLALSAQQLTCLRALAMIGDSKIDKVFVEETGIPLLPSIRKAMNRLVERRVAMNVGGMYRLCDPFFASWIRAKGI